MNEILIEFDVLYNDIQLPFPSNIKTKVINKHGRARRLHILTLLINSTEAGNLLRGNGAIRLPDYLVIEVEGTISLQEISNV